MVWLKLDIANNANHNIFIFYIIIIFVYIYVINFCQRESTFHFYLLFATSNHKINIFLLIIHYFIHLILLHLIFIHLLFTFTDKYHLFYIIIYVICSNYHNKHQHLHTAYNIFNNNL